MRRKIGTVMMGIGLVLVLIAIFQYSEHRVKLEKALAQAESIIEIKADNKTETIDRSEDAPELEPLQAPKATSNFPMVREQLNASENDVIGILEIPKIEAELPIIEGTDEEMLEKGVGHYAASVFPSDGEQILLSGHRDTVFRKFADLAIGDRFIVKMPYGTFEYEIASSEIVDKDDTSVIRPMGEEVLVVSTCYPFRYVGDAPDRYVVYAYPVALDHE